MYILLCWLALWLHWLSQFVFWGTEGRKCFHLPRVVRFNWCVSFCPHEHKLQCNFLCNTKQQKPARKFHLHKSQKKIWKFCIRRWTRCRNVRGRTWNSFETLWSQQLPDQAVIKLKEAWNLLLLRRSPCYHTFIKRDCHSGGGSIQEPLQAGQSGLNVLCRIWLLNFWPLSALQHFTLGCSQVYKLSFFPLALWISQISTENKDYS